MSLRVAGFDVESSLKLPFRIRPIIVIEHQHATERHMRLWQRLIQRDSLLSCRFGLGHDLGGSSVDAAHCRISIRNPGIGWRIFDVFLDRLLEIIQSSVD